MLYVFITLGAFDTTGATDIGTFAFPAGETCGGGTADDNPGDNDGCGNEPDATDAVGA